MYIYLAEFKPVLVVHMSESSVFLYVVVIRSLAVDELLLE